MILLLDNYDSFVHNVARALRELGAEVEVVRSDRLTVSEAIVREASGVVISPGPGTPDEAGISVELVRELGGRVPVLGICLGHQAVAAAYGAGVGSSPAPTHGRESAVYHRGGDLFAGIPSPFPAGRYHSLSVDERSLPRELEPAAWTARGELMAVRHRDDPVWGIQFHPESVLTPSGAKIFENFLHLVRRRPADRPAARSRLAIAKVP